MIGDLIHDEDVKRAIFLETARQEFKLELIASENYTSLAVLAAQGCLMTNKYAEGYPGKRYYGGCEYVDQVETLAQERACRLFQSEYVNVQPHSGSQANLAVYFSALNPGDTFLGMDLTHGGHLTHGSPVNFSGKLYRAVHYGVKRETELIDYDDLFEKARAHQPKMIIVGGSAYSRNVDYRKFREISDEVGAKLMADIAHPAGLIAAGLCPSPIGIADFVTTTTHKTLRGPRGGMIFARKDDAQAINSSLFPRCQGGPLMHVIAAKAVALGEALQPAFKQYAAKILENAQILGKTLQEGGVRVVSGGTDTHLLLLDLSRQEITGKEAEEILGQAGITVNKNTIPFETRSPFVTSGIRVGTPAVTTRGMGTKEMKLIGEWILEVLNGRQEKSGVAEIRKKVRKLCEGFPIYPQLLKEVPPSILKDFP